MTKDRVCVVGLGRMGLPLAVRVAESGYQVLGADISESAVALINQGIAPFGEEAGLHSRLADAVAAGRLSAMLDVAEAAAASQVIIVIVPLTIAAGNVPDFSALDSVTHAIATGLQPGVLVSYETTLPLHTTRKRFVPILEAGSGLRVGDSLFVAFSPERVSSGKVFADLARYPKLVGGVDEASELKAAEFYASALTFDERPELPRPNGVWPMGSSEAAELAKLAETTYRDINIAFANELAKVSDRAGVDVYAVIQACNSQPFSHLHQPGIAVGGHCIPVYPYLYLAGDSEAMLPTSGRTVNEGMPGYCLDLLEAAMGPLVRKRVGVLGLAFRGDLKSDARSGAFDLIRLLGDRGAQALVHDPLWGDDELVGMGLVPYALGNEIDAAIVQTDHSSYQALRESDLPGAVALLDGRNITRADNFPNLRRVVLGNGVAS